MLDPGRPFGDFDPAAPDDRGAFRFREDRDVGAVISATFGFLRATWRELGLGLLYIVGPVALLTALAQFFFQQSMFGVLEAVEGTDPNDPGAVLDAFSSLFGPSFVVAALGGTVSWVLVTSVVLSYVRLYREGRAGTIRPGVLWAETSHLLWPMFGLTLALWAMMVLSALLNVIPCLGTIAWAGLLVYAVPVLATVFPARAFAAEGGDYDGVAGALRHARELVYGAWLPTFGVAVIAFVLYYAFTLALALPTSIVSMVVGMNAASGEPATVGTGMRILLGVGSLLGAVASFFFSIPLVAGAFQYFTLREKVEGGGLRARLDALDGGVPPLDPPLGPPGDRDRFGPPPADAWPAPGPRPAPGAEAADPAAAPGEADGPSESPPRAPSAPDRPGFRGAGFDDDADRRWS